jgi:hypothetical protein
VARELHDAGVAEVQQAGEKVDPTQARGPIRIAPGPALER